MEASSEMNVLDGFVPESEGQLEKVEVENVTASRILMALWKKGYRAGFRRLCRSNVSGLKVGAANHPIKKVRKIGTRKALLKMHQNGSGAGGKPCIKH